MRASRAASLLLVFALAKSIVLAGHHVPFSCWAPVAYLWQDASVVLVFVALECTLVRRQGIVWRGTFYSRAQLEAGQRLSPGSLRVALPTSPSAE